MNLHLQITILSNHLTNQYKRMARYNHEGIQFLSDTRTHHYHKRIRIYMHTISTIKNKRSMSIVRFLTVQSQTCHLFILGSLHIPCPTMGTLSDCIDYKCLYGNSAFICTSGCISSPFPTNERTKRYQSAFSGAHPQRRLYVRKLTCMYTNNDCCKNNDVWTNYSKFVNISYA